MNKIILITIFISFLCIAGCIKKNENEVNTADNKNIQENKEQSSTNQNDLILENTYPEKVYQIGTAQKANIKEQLYNDKPKLDDVNISDDDIIKNIEIFHDFKKGKMFFPKNRAELRALLKNENINLALINISRISNLAYIFKDIKRQNFDGIEKWNTSHVKFMHNMFEGTPIEHKTPAWFFDNDPDIKYTPQNREELEELINNEDIYLGDIDIINVGILIRLFKDGFTHRKDLSGIELWDTSYVYNMSEMFSGYTGKIPNIEHWNTSNVIDMSRMFENVSDFNQDISTWDTSNVVTMEAMFKNAASFDACLNNWNTSNVKYMNEMFYGAQSFQQDINLWDTSKVENMQKMFFGAKLFNSDIGKWNTSNVKSMDNMFNGAVSFNQNINSWDTSKITNMNALFKNAKVFNQPLDKWKINNVTDISEMFNGAESFNQNINSWDTSNVENMSNIFLNSGLENNEPLWYTLFEESLNERKNEEYKEY